MKKEIPSEGLLLTIVFLCGFVLMTFEIVGSRVLAPVFGTSTYVWASIIGVVLGAMSIGYVYGGKVADQNPYPGALGKLIFSGAVSILLMNLGKGALLSTIANWSIVLVLKSTIAAVILFSAPAFFLATVVPFILRIAFTEVENSGKVVGRFYAVSTVGSILGTFSGAVLFIPLVGTNNILWILATILFGCSFLCMPIKKKTETMIFLFLLAGNVVYSFYPRAYIDKDTFYNRVRIFDGEEDNRKTRYLQLNGYINSGMYLETPNELLYPYTQFYRLIEHFVPDFKHVLMLGGGGYSFPKYYLNNYPDRKIDVVEIDGELSELSEAYFNLRLNNQIQIYTEDARTYVENTPHQYDAILCDVFSSTLSAPFQLATLEFYQLAEEKLKEDGIFMVNILGSNDAEKGVFLHSQLKTINEVFPQVMTFAVQERAYKGKKNYMVLASKSKKKYTLKSKDEALQNMLNRKELPTKGKNAFILTDDFAPVDWMLMQ